MALEIPAEQVPFVRKYFQLLNSLAENSPPGQNLRIDRELLSSLTDEQLEGFKRLVSYFHEQVGNNQRNKVASQDAKNLRNYYLNENTHDTKIDKYELFFSRLDDEETLVKQEQLKKICNRLKKYKLSEPDKLQYLVSLIPDFYRIESFIDIDKFEGILELFQEFAGERYPTTEQLEAMKEIILEYCEMSEHERQNLQESLYSRYEARERHAIIKNAVSLNNSNLRTMTNYLGFFPPEGGKRKTKKTRKLRRKH